MFLYVVDIILHTIKNVKKLYSRYDPPQKKLNNRNHILKGRIDVKKLVLR